MDVLPPGSPDSDDTEVLPFTFSEASPRRALDRETPTGPAYIVLPWADGRRIRVASIHDVAVIFVGMFCLLSQAVASFLWDREPHYWIIVAGLTCLGYGWAVWRDRRNDKA